MVTGGTSGLNYNDVIVQLYVPMVTVSAVHRQQVESIHSVHQMVRHHSHNINLMDKVTETDMVTMTVRINRPLLDRPLWVETPSAFNLVFLTFCQF